MNLRKVVSNLIEAQNIHNSLAYAECFSDTAVVFDEGKTHNGKVEIQKWIEKSNREYQSVMKALNYEETDAKGLLTAEVSGNFPGSPAILQFHFVLKDELIESLRITG